MRFLTLNTHSWCEIHQIAKIRTLAKFIIEQQVDVIALQEVNQLTSTPVVKEPLNYRGGAGVPVREDNYALLLVQALNEMGATYEWTLTETHLGWERYDECVAVLSRMPIRGIRPIDMSPDYTYFQVQRRAAQAALIETPSGSFWCATTHMSWWDFDGEPLFAQEFTRLSQALAECAETAPVLLGGDFNSAAHLPDEGYAFVTSTGLIDTRAIAKHTKGENTVPAGRAPRMPSASISCSPTASSTWLPTRWSSGITPPRRFPITAACSWRLTPQAGPRRAS